MSEDVPPMVRADFRLPARLKDRVQAQAEREGLDFSEWVRQTLEVRLAWMAATDAVHAGADPEALRDYDLVLAALAEILARKH